MWGDRDDGDYDVNAFAYGFDVFSNVLCLTILLYLVFSLWFFGIKWDLYMMKLGSDGLVHTNKRIKTMWLTQELRVKLYALLLVFTTQHLYRSDSRLDIFL